MKSVKQHLWRSGAVSSEYSFPVLWGYESAQEHLFDTVSDEVGDFVFNTDPKIFRAMILFRDQDDWSDGR